MNALTHPLRKACSECGGLGGEIVSRSGQDCVFCLCGKYQYNAPKTETGRKARSVQTTHSAIKPKQRSRILERANRSCEICHATDRHLHVGHVVSVADGHKSGLPDDIINSDENLIAQCEECNLGNGNRTLPLRLLIGVLIARTGTE